MAMLLYSCIMLYLRAIGCEALDETGKLAQEVGETPPVKQARAPCMFQRLSVKVNGNIKIIKPIWTVAVCWACLTRPVQSEPHWTSLDANH